mmetsp:Transcript_5971/g.12954  ORF Transcript_5971/g.12954 Transcript_5971/m.12954 type:complete len:226 (+) Transcript_5971:82-759(+)
MKALVHYVIAVGGLLRAPKPDRATLRANSLQPNPINTVGEAFCDKYSGLGAKRADAPSVLLNGTTGRDVTARAECLAGFGIGSTQCFAQCDHSEEDTCYDACMDQKLFGYSSEFQAERSKFYTAVFDYLVYSSPHKKARERAKEEKATAAAFKERQPQQYNDMLCAGGMAWACNCTNNATLDFLNEDETAAKTSCADAAKARADAVAAAAAAAANATNATNATVA